LYSISLSGCVEDTSLWTKIMNQLTVH